MRSLASGRGGVWRAAAVLAGAGAIGVLILGAGAGHSAPGAPTGKLTYKNCITGAIEAGPVSGGGTGACKAIPSATAGADASGMSKASALTASADGRSVYAVSADGDAVATFKRDRSSGKLTYKGCITGAIEAGPVSGGGSGACKAIAGATSLGAESGLDDLEAVAASADGRSVYAGSGADSAIATFKRDRSSGKLTYKGCITGEIESGPVSSGGSGACKATPAPTAGGGESGLASVGSVAASSDGRSVYAEADGDSAIATFKRDRKSGKLTYKRCITGETESGPVSGGGTGACKAAPVTAAGGNNSGIARLSFLAVTADGRNLYGVSSDDAAVATFKRDRKSGKLTYKGCIAGATEAGPVSGGGSGACKAIPAVAPDGFGSGLASLESIAFAGGDKSLYVAANSDAAVATFKRDRSSGKLTYKGCITGDTLAGPVSGGGTGACKAIPSAISNGSDSGLSAPESVAASRDGRSVYAALSDDASVATFKRDRSSGKLTYKGCITGDLESGPVSGGGTGACKAIADAQVGGSNSGLASVESLTVTLDGRSVYGSTESDSSVFTLKRQR